MSMSKHKEAQMTGALKQLEAGNDTRRFAELFVDAGANRLTG
jgi:hypothetical protein